MEMNIQENCCKKISSYGILFLLIAFLTGCQSKNTNKSPANLQILKNTFHIELAGGKAEVDFYFNKIKTKMPLVIVVHGFGRSKYNMSGWGTFLAENGFLAAVPNLPSWSNHELNSKYISELVDFIIENKKWESKIDKKRIALIGFSAGGLETLLAASENHKIKIWIGLDPVEWNDLGTENADKVKCSSAILTADPSLCNDYGNYKNILSKLPDCIHYSIKGANHTDAEWPSDWLAELFCGKTSEDCQNKFRSLTIETLNKFFFMQMRQAVRLI